MEDDFGALAPDLANAGYCVYAFNYGALSPNALIEAIGPVPQSAQQLATFVSQVLSRTGAAKVDLVGHSQGGMLLEYYAKLLGGASLIHKLIALSPTTHGTSLDGLANLASFIPGANQVVGGVCPACADQESGSAVIRQLDNGPIAQPGVAYTIIASRSDELVTPTSTAFVNEPGVHDEYVQDSCPFDPVGHVGLAFDLDVSQLVANALDPAHPQPVTCSFGPTF